MRRPDFPHFTVKRIWALLEEERRRIRKEVTNRETELALLRTSANPQKTRLAKGLLTKSKNRLSEVEETIEGWKRLLGALWGTPRTKLPNPSPDDKVRTAIAETCRAAHAITDLGLVEFGFRNPDGRRFKISVSEAPESEKRKVRKGESL